MAHRLVIPTVFAILLSTSSIHAQDVQSQTLLGVKPAIPTLTDSEKLLIRDKQVEVQSIELEFNRLKELHDITAADLDSLIRQTNAQHPGFTLQKDLSFIADPNKGKVIEPKK